MEFKIEDIIGKFLGLTEPIGETNYDKEALKNLDNYEEVLNYLIEKLLDTSLSRDSYEASVKACGEKAFQILKDAEEYIRESLGEENEK